MDVLGVIQNCHHFHKNTQSTLGGGGGEGINGRRTLFKNIDYYVAFSYGIVKNQHFQSTLLGGREGVTKKSTLCTLLKMLTIMDDPLGC